MELEMDDLIFLGACSIYANMINRGVKEPMRAAINQSQEIWSTMKRMQREERDAIRNQLNSDPGR